MANEERKTNEIQNNNSHRARIAQYSIKLRNICASHCERDSNETNWMHRKNQRKMLHNTIHGIERIWEKIHANQASVDIKDAAVVSITFYSNQIK